MVRPARARPPVNEPFERLIEHTDDMVLAMDLDGVIGAANPGAERVLGYRPDELVGTRIADYLPARETERARALFDRISRGAASVHAEFEHIAKGGHTVFVDVAAFPVRDGDRIVGVEGIARDVTVQHAMQAELVRQSLHDPLTGLPNRTLCVDRINQAIERSARGHMVVAVLLLDVDEFKVINDTFGHAAGDELLIDLAGRLRAVCRQHETVARMGGDEFVVVAEQVRDERDLLALGDRVRSVFAEPFATGTTTRQMTGSLGVAVSGPGMHASELLRDADTAMYRIKASGKAAIGVFDQGQRDEFLQRVAVEAGLREAVGAGELEVYFQPIVDPRSGRVLAAEALSRWQHPRLGWIQPSEFIPIAETSGLIVSLGRHVLREAVRYAAHWHAECPGALPLGVFVNVSPRELAEYGFVDTVAATLDEFGLDASQLALELTEHVILDDRDRAVLENLGLLSSAGIRLIIDDFGTGYSALSSLRKYPFAALKIDRCFVEEIDSMDAPAPIIRALVALGKTLSMMVIAEGVETGVQHDYLLRLGCDAEQGFGIRPPLAADEMTALLRDEQGGTRTGAAGALAPPIAPDAGTWTPAPIGAGDEIRLDALRTLEVLDTEPEAAFDEIAGLVAHICETPMAFVSLVDAEREYFKAAIGSPLREAPRDHSFCGHAIAEPGLFIIEDALRDPRFAANPDVIAGTRVRFYAGAPITTSSGHTVGMLCVKDIRPRELSPIQREALVVLGRQVAAMLELRRIRTQAYAAQV